LRAWSGGKKTRSAVPLVYEELRRRARQYMARERPGITFQSTALVNEVYLLLVDATEVQWQDRACPFKGRICWGFWPNCYLKLE